MEQGKKGKKEVDNLLTTELLIAADCVAMNMLLFKEILC
jgi:hypothetical protein